MTEHIPTPEQIADAVEILSMCEPIRDVQGGMWFGHNQNFADATFVDYGACRAFAVAARALPHLSALVEALQFIADGYDNHDVNHVDYRVKVYQVALDALASIKERA